MNRRVLVPARIQELAGDAVAALTGPLRYQQITALDPAPMFVSLTVAHEGVSRGEVVGLGARLKEWGRRVIARLAELLEPSGRPAALIFDGSTSWHVRPGRQPCGEVVASRGLDVGGRLQAEAVGYIYAGQTQVRELIRRGALDVCSVEAEVFLDERGARPIVQEVLAATAVVLGDSRKQQPGFAGARVQMITEFMPEEGDAGAAPGGAAGTVQPPPATPPPPPVAPAAAPQLSREQLIEQAQAAGITAADFAPGAPLAAPAIAPAIIPAPPERRGDGQRGRGDIDLTSPLYNEFLPAD